MTWGIEVTAEKYIIHLPAIAEVVYSVYILGFVIVILVLGWFVRRWIG